MDNGLMFGFFHSAYENSPEIFRYVIKQDYVNTILVECDYKSEDFKKSFDALKGTNIKVWVDVKYLGFEVVKSRDMFAEGFNPVTVFHEDYKERANGLVNFLKENGYYEQVVGFYMDEPLLWNIKNEWLEEFSGYFRTVIAPDKRYLVCFSVAGVAPDYWTINGVKPINKKSAQYLTDIAFDRYKPWSADYEGITKEMLERAGNRDDLKVWFVPATMNYRSVETEDYALAHLNGCYDLLKKQKNPGGLLCYTFSTLPNEHPEKINIGMMDLISKDNPHPWTRLMKRAEEIGRELCKTDK